MAAEAQKPTGTEGEVNAEAEAVAVSAALNRNLLASEQERSYASLRSKHDTLNTKHNERESLVSSLEGKISDLQQQVTEHSAALSSANNKAEDGAKKATKAEERERDANERMARVHLEADALRQEISRLQNDSKALKSQITEQQASSTLSTSSSAPLQFENSRLRTELESHNSHCKWLEGELETRTTQVSDLKISHSRLTHELRNNLNDEKTKCDELDSEANRLKLNNESIKRRLDSSQKQLLNNERENADMVHELNMEIQSERRLVTLNKENLARVEDRYNDVIREIESMKSIAAAAEEEHASNVLAIKAEIEQDFQKALEQDRLESGKQVDEYKKQLDDALADKAQIEDEFMAGGSGRLAIGDGKNSQGIMRLEYTSTDGEPITLTNLYEKLANAEEDVRQERAERKRVELYLERVRKDIECAVPTQLQERKEYELAMDQNQDMHNRLREAVEESQSARDELLNVQRELRETTRETRELRLENGDLASQVQQLLQKSLGGEDLAEEMQSQNQRLLTEHHRMASTIAELEEKIDADVVQQKLGELDKIKAEMQNQATFVSDIVQQRDLYRALLIKNDAALLANIGDQGCTAIVAAKDQIEKYTEIESKNKDMVDSIAKLTADLTTTNNAKIGLEERLLRLDAHATELSLTHTKLQADLSQAYASSARSEAESSFHQQKTARLEETVEAARSEHSRLTNEKAQLQRLSEDLQSALSVSRNNESRNSEEFRQVNVSLKLVEAKYKYLTEAETRLTAENSSLRSENARHIALQESMQKIEANLTARGTEDQHRLEEEVAKLSSKAKSEQSEHAVAVEKMQNQVADADLRTRDAEKKLEETLANSMTAKDELIGANTEVKLLSEKCKSLESALDAAKIKLGDLNIDTSIQEKIDTLSQNLEASQAGLLAAKKQAEDYKTMSLTNEKALNESTRANGEFKTLTTAQIKKLTDDLKFAQDTSRAKQEALEEISKDLSTSRGQQEKTVDDLKANVDALKSDLETAKKDSDSAMKQREEMMGEMTIYQADVRAAKDNYERELALHADARKELQQVRAAKETEVRSHQTVKAQLDNISDETARERDVWEETKKRLEEAQCQAEARLNEYKDQNKILHAQMITLNETVEKMKSQNVNAATNDTSMGGENTNDATSLEKQLAETREVIRFMQNEKEVIEVQLQSSRRTAERDRAAAEIAKRSLEQLRVEMSVFQSEREQALASSGGKAEVEAKLKQGEDQLVLLRESNKLLRNETDKLNANVTSFRTDAEKANTSLEPLEVKCKSLEVEKAAFAAEKASLIREIDDWKDRVKSLVTKFNQIDPEEHANLIKKVEEFEKECAASKVSKEKASREAASAKSIVLRLNKEMTRQKALVETTKGALEKAKEEKKKLVAGSAASAQKDAAEAAKARETAEKALVSAKQDHESTKKRMEGLKKLLRQNKLSFTNTQKSLEDTLRKEKEEKALVVSKNLSLEEAMKALKKQEENSAKMQNDVNMGASGHEKNDEPTERLPSKDSAENLIPKVPAEGFKFVASESASSHKTKKDDVVKNNTNNLKEEGQKDVKLNTEPSKGDPHKSNSTQIPPNQASVLKTKSDSTSNLNVAREAGSSLSLPPKMQAAVSKPTTSSIKSVIKAKTNDKTVPLPPKTSIVSKPVASKPKSKEGSLREKLLERKRQLEQKMAAPPAKRPASSTPSPSPPTPSTSKVNLKDASDEPTGKSVEKKNVKLASISENGPKIVGKMDSANSQSEEKVRTEPPIALMKAKLSANASPFKLFSAKNATASLDTSAPKSGSAFLNLKPPGSGQSTPLIFGSSASIKLPTPSKDPLPGAQQQFTSFGTNIFGSSSTFGTASNSNPLPSALFGSAPAKKRQLEVDEKEEDSSAQVSKVAKVEKESDTSIKDTVATETEESKNLESES